jgi:hypothetical protein
MRGILIIAAIIIGLVSAVRAQQPSDSPPDSSQGPNFPSPGSDRGPAFPKSVSPTGSNQTNWAAPQPQYTDPNALNPRARRWLNERAKWDSGR